MAELDDLREHLERFRAVTLQALDLVTDDDLGWRPGRDHLSLGQQLLHIAQSEDFRAQAYLHGDWDYERVCFPTRDLRVGELRARLHETRGRTLVALEGLEEGRLDEPVDHGEGEPIQTLRWWLWLLVEHEVHHKAQIVELGVSTSRTADCRGEGMEQRASSPRGSERRFRLIPPAEPGTLPIRFPSPQ